MDWSRLCTERGLMAYDGWFKKASHTGDHPREHYGNAVTIVPAALCLIPSLRRSHG